MNKVYRNLEDLCQVLDSKRIPITANKRTPGPYPYYGANGYKITSMNISLMMI